MVKKFGNTTLTTFPTEADVYLDMALAMYDEIKKNNDLGKKTVMIVPVGPTGQYPIFARLVNETGLSLKNVYFFNMDEYMITPTETIAHDHPMSFHLRMKTELYDRLLPELTIPEDHRFFPEPGKEKEYDQMIEDLGGVDLCLGGLGINGHVAFNEAAEEDDPITADEFAALPTRVLPISRETRTINAYGYQRGDLRGMPEWCITIGMKQILAARKIYIGLNRPWQNGPFKHALRDEYQGQIPATLLRRNPNLTYCTTTAIAEGAM